ncbi:MAG: type VI immunity family protein [Myxococcota bacterium]
MVETFRESLIEEQRYPFREEAERRFTDALVDRVGRSTEASVPVPNALDVRAFAPDGEGPTVSPWELKIERYGERVAAVELGLTLYLGFCPSFEECVAAIGAFQHHFPWSGTVVARSAGEKRVERIRSPSAVFEWREFLEVRPAGFGLVASDLGSEPANDPHTIPRQSIAIEAVRGPRPNEIATFCRIRVAPESDPKKFAALAGELVDVLPVRSGWGGYEAHSGETNLGRGQHAVFDWSRRYFGIEVADPDALLPLMRAEAKGANWITVLGPAMLEAIGEPSFDNLEISIDERTYGMVIQAGDDPTLGDVCAAAFPEEYSEVERWLQPVKLRDPIPLNDVFTANGASGAWFRRLLFPADLLAPTTLELLQRAEHAARTDDQIEVGQCLARLRGRASVPDLRTRLLGIATVLEERDLDELAGEFRQLASLSNVHRSAGS